MSGGESEDSGEQPWRRLSDTEERDRTDRISALPESVIVHILSFLPTLDSIRTRVLSRRWQYLWTCVPTLFFDFTDNRRGPNRPDYDDPGEDSDGNKDLIDFFEFVDKALVLCDGSVKNFCVKSDYEKEKQFASSANSWTRFAVRNGVEKFELDFYGPERQAESCFKEEFALPQFLYTNSIFRELRFSLCKIKPKTTVAWNSLKFLSIGYVCLNDDLIQRILAGTPVLETLELHNFCWDDDRLHIINSSVKKLILRESLSSLEILAPNILSLEVSCDLEKCQLVDVKSLVEVTLFDLYFYLGDDDMVNGARGLFNSLAHVKTLKLGTWAIMGLKVLHTQLSSCPLMKCECLTIGTKLWVLHPLGIAILLRYFPLVQTLIFTTSTTYGIESQLASLEKEFLVSPIPFSGFQSLKIVEFYGVWNYKKPYFELVEILLKNARMLQKMIIHMDVRYHNYCKPNEMFKAAQKLLSFQRSFPSVEILVYG